MGNKKTILEKIKANKIKYLAPLMLLASTKGEAQELKKDTLFVLPLPFDIQKYADEFQMFRESETDAFALIALTENCEMQSYNCSVRETVGLGSTVDFDGQPIKKGRVLKDFKEARDLVQLHLERLVYPQIKKFVSYERLDKHQMAALVSLFYNVKPEALTGHNDKMEKVGEPSNLVKFINSGASMDECAKRIFAFCRAGGRSAPGLKKRRYLEKMYFEGKLTFEDVLGFDVGGIYQASPFDICASKANAKGYYDTKDTEKALNSFKKISSLGKGKKVSTLMKELGFELNYQLSTKDFDPRIPFTQQKSR